MKREGRGRKRKKAERQRGQRGRKGEREGGRTMQGVD